MRSQFYKIIMKFYSLMPIVLIITTLTICRPIYNDQIIDIKILYHINEGHTHQPIYINNIFVMLAMCEGVFQIL